MDPRTIPLLAQGTFKLLPAARVLAITGAAPKEFLVFGTAMDATPAEVAQSRSWSSAFVAKGRKRLHCPECATEEAISLVGRTLPLKVAKSRLVRVPTPAGPEVRFLSRFFLAPNEELLHGNELAAIWMNVQQRELESVFHGTRSEEQSLYNVDVIVELLRNIDPHHDPEPLIDSFARMMAFDALVGANDRHAKNWGVIRNTVIDQPVRFAPVYDTAKGLFWDHWEDRLVQEEGRVNEYVRRYAARSTPLIGLPKQAGGTRINHFDVITFMVQERPELFGSGIRQVVHAYRPDDVARLLRRRFRHILTRRRLLFIDTLLRHRHARLIEITTGRRLR